MNKELMLVATGIGIGALAFTDQGRKLMGAVMGPSFLPFGESDNDPKNDKEDGKKALERGEHHTGEESRHDESTRQEV